MKSEIAKRTQIRKEIREDRERKKRRFKQESYLKL